jgi:hypothetical protein
MIPTENLRPQIERYQRLFLLIGVIALGICAIGLVTNKDQFFRSYLYAYIYWNGLAIGCLGVYLLHNVVGGNWGVVIRRFLESGTRTLPLTFLLLIPVLIGMPSLYPWTNPDIVAHSHAIEVKKAFLNTPFFILRSVIYFAIWMGFGFVLLRMSGEQDRTGDPDRAIQTRMRQWSAPGLLIFVLTTTYAFVDWIMSLEPEWYSTIYPWMFTVGQVLETFGFVIALLILFSRFKPFSEVLSPLLYNDLANLMLAFTMLWAYMSVSQFLIIWAENLPDEIPWYVRRFSGGWGWMIWFISIFHFCVPFVLLLMRFIKRNPALLYSVAVWMVIVRIVDVFWVIEPAFRQRGLSLSWMDFAAPIGIGGIWLAFFLWHLKARPLLPLHDPRLSYRHPVQSET